MSDITLTKVSGPDKIRQVSACGVVSCSLTNDIPDNTVITIRNFLNLEINLESPAGDFPIPETEDFGNIVIKAEGNRLQFNLSWVIKDEGCSSVVSGPCAPTITTVQQQLDYWLNYFQPYSIEGKYLFKVDGLARIGFLRRIGFSKSQQSPVTYDASLEFIAGDVVAGE